jgi:hypothetical protein
VSILFIAYNLLGTGTLRAQPYVQFGSIIISNRFINSGLIQAENAPIIIRNVTVNGNGSWDLTSFHDNGSPFGTHSEIIVRRAAFMVGLNGQISCQKCLLYGLGGGWGLLNYSFDDIKLAAVTDYGSFNNISSGDEFVFTCIVVKKRDSTYSKVQVLEKLQDNRFVFKYGSNTTPLERKLEKADYDRSFRYKPNNVTLHYHCNCSGESSAIPDSLFWEPPLQNTNHLKGYILYNTKPGMVVDTTKQINIAQWDSIAFTESTLLTNKLPSDCYVNMIAVYEEGTSDFIQGWSRYSPLWVRIDKNQNAAFHLQNKLTLHKLSRGRSIYLQTPTKQALLSIYSLTGKKIAQFSYFKDKPFCWNPIQQNIPVGLYLLRAEFPDRSVITQLFTITR